MPLIHNIFLCLRPLILFLTSFLSMQSVTHKTVDKEDDNIAILCAFDVVSMQIISPEVRKPTCNWVCVNCTINCSTLCLLNYFNPEFRVNFAKILTLFSSSSLLSHFLLIFFNSLSCLIGLTPLPPPINTPVVLQGVPIHIQIISSSKW